MTRLQGNIIIAQLSIICGMISGISIGLTHIANAVLK